MMILKPSVRIFLFFKKTWVFLELTRKMFGRLLLFKLFQQPEIRKKRYEPYREKLEIVFMRVIHNGANWQVIKRYDWARKSMTGIHYLYFH